MAGSVITHYEVYALDDQRWVLQARFHGAEKDQAVNEAKSIEKNVLVATKVVREVYHPGNNVAEEQVVYISDKALREASAKRIGGSARGPGGAVGGAQGAAVGGDSSYEQMAGEPLRSGFSMGVMLKLIIVICVSMIVAGAVTGVVSTVLDKYPQYTVLMSDSTLSLVMFSSFVVSFLLTAVPLATTLINWRDTGGRGASRKAVDGARSVLGAAQVAAGRMDARSSQFLNSTTGSAGASAGAKVDDAPVVIIANPEAPANEPSLIFEAVPDLPSAEKKVAAAAAGEPAKPTKPAEPEMSAEEKKAMVTNRLQTQLIDFLGGVLAVVKTTRPSLDAYNKFGLDLMMAGAVELIASQRHLEGDEKRKILCSVIESTGTRPQTASAFADRVDEYLVEQRYLGMIQAGRAAMDNFQNGLEGTRDLIRTAVDTWNKPQVQQLPRIITVMFTDMVGSTDMTQAEGDQAAQTVVRRHNAIVRAVLAELGGKEIKHTGDGIMASFVSTTNGVEAAIAIQKAVADHNGAHPQMPLHLRIGLNSGEPIEEEDDLFGTTVQLAARVCAKAGTDQIYCSNVVRELSSGKKIVFNSLGQHALKGFRDPMELFEVMWTQS